MLTLLHILHIVLSLSLIFIVLIQAGKGSGVGLSIGGGMSQTMFGGSGGKTFFMKLTTGIAFAFMITSMILAYMASHTAQGYHGVMSGRATQQAPALPQGNGLPATVATAIASPGLPVAPQAAPKPGKP
jgi:preprotein translocase subunit SecG